MPNDVDYMKVKSTGFPDDTLTIQRNKDLGFYKGDDGAPSTVIVQAGLLANGVTTCTVNADKHGANNVTYEVVGANGDYTVSKPAGLTADKSSGTIKVNG